ncbi:acyl transferase/acyl hydrolase/lysophospholipase [Geopyxis carbonaria]|nr:acyl transferase/acyl hydrolase/lysophospholipase [Geopyxis carbonaria]
MPAVTAVGQETTFKPLRNKCCQCEEEKKDDDLFWCHLCKAFFCKEPCWKQQGVHKINTLHVPTELKYYYELNSILEDINQVGSGEARHRANYSSKWFGVTATDVNSPTLSTSTRFQELIRSTNTNEEQYPALISFLGDTGAGKSSLINIMVKVTLNNIKSPRAEIAPVVAESKGGDMHKPTSGDVHLFRDPSTKDSPRPCFYADCEGLKGGNTKPAAEKEMSHGKTMWGTVGDKRRIEQVLIRWLLPNNDPEDSSDPQDSKDVDKKTKYNRQNIVETLYPKVLYTFSDVVIFVNSNARTLENSIFQLIEWAETALEISVNQPILPHVILIMNSVNTAETENIWKDDCTTKQLNKFNHSIKMPPLSKFASDWKRRGKPIETLQELVSCYYSSIRISYIPDFNGRPQFVLEQYDSLYNNIHESVEKTREEKQQAQLLLKSEDMNAYFGYAFDHFSEHETKPFNFLQAAFTHNPVPGTFSSHIMKSALCLMKSRIFVGEKRKSSFIFEFLAPFVASCIVLEVCRNDMLLKEKAFPNYEANCRDAVTQFYNNHWPCSYSHKSNACVNVQNGHPKGHQTADGTIFKVGEYKSEDLEPAFLDGTKFVEEVGNLYLGYLKKIQSNSSNFSRPGANAAENQRKVLYNFQELWNNPKPLSSHSTCFACLFYVPQTVLPCGHVICRKCVKDFARNKGDLTWSFQQCPLCAHPAGMNTKDPWSIEVPKYPYEAAPRVLSLDGGGVRSILQLQTLRMLEERIDLGIPIQDFFDLIIGTSAGGIIALGLGVKQLSVDECERMFYEFATRGFARRSSLKSLTFINNVVEVCKGSKYKSKKMNDVLKDTLGADDKIFGESHYARSGTDQKMMKSNIKVGVTLSSISGHSCLVTNYNLAIHQPTKYRFLREETKDRELKIWEAARATSAAPYYFKNFRHKPTGRVFSDGALHYNNPISIADSESRILWKKHENRGLFVSIGTGSTKPCDPDTSHESNEKFTLFSLLPKLPYNAVKAGQIILKEALDSQKQWEQFISGDGVKRENYMRSSIVVDDLPKLDNVKGIEDLVFKGEEDHLSQAGVFRLEQVSNRLIASLFYFQSTNIEEQYPNSRQNTHYYDCTGENPWQSNSVVCITNT